MSRDEQAEPDNIQARLGRLESIIVDCHSVVNGMYPLPTASTGTEAKDTVEGTVTATLTRCIQDTINLKERLQTMSTEVGVL